MDKIIINGGVPLKGTIHIGGAKNAALPLMAASVLTKDTLTLSNIPHLADISTMANLLVSMGVELNLDGSNSDDGHIGRVIALNASAVKDTIAPYDMVRKMRASVVVLGPLLARFGHARVSLPGGCAIGSRPIDIHLAAMEAMGATITLEDGYVDAVAENGLKGGEYTFPLVSVGATENAVMAATLANGTVTLKNCAREPEVADLCECLVKMGADIKGIGSDTLVVTGVSALHGAEHRVIPDRIETGTYAVAAMMTGGELTLEDTDVSIMESTLDVLRRIGGNIEETEHSITISADKNALSPLTLATDPYPGFATDMQAQVMALLCLAKGESVISETIFENRFMHVAELVRMGAHIDVHDHTATITGMDVFHGAEVMATDLRASVSLVLAGLAAEGETVINRVYHIDRGYEFVEDKLSMCGAKILRVKG